MSENKAPPMLARATGSSAADPHTASASRSDEALATQATPEDVFSRLQQLIEEGNITGARRLTEEAQRRFPNHPRIALARRVLAPPTVRLTELAQPTVQAEKEWLANPPAEAMGKWVALIGAKVVGIADSIEELAQIVKASNPEQIPVVQHLAP